MRLYHGDVNKEKKGKKSKRKIHAFHFTTTSVVELSFGKNIPLYDRLYVQTSHMTSGLHNQKPHSSKPASKPTCLSRTNEFQNVLTCLSRTAGWVHYDHTFYSPFPNAALQLGHWGFYSEKFEYLKVIFFEGEEYKYVMPFLICLFLPILNSVFNI